MQFIYLSLFSFLISLSLLSQAKLPMKESMVLDNIYLFRKAEPHRYGSGQPTIDQLKGLKQAGIDVVINLRPHNEHDDTEEKQLLEATGVEYYNVGINGAKGLTIDNIQAFDKMLNSIPKDKTVLMHCLSSNRVGAMMALRANWLNQANIEESLALGEKYGLKSLKNTVKAKLQAKPN